MSLLEQVARVFAPEGPLARVLPYFRSRCGQMEMASAVAHAIDEPTRLVVEAGTGIGKTFAYLVPALLSGRRVVVSTATKALQDQLHGRDLPLLQQALALPLRVALLKGRSSYLCRHRLDLARRGEIAHPADLERDLARIGQWAQATQTGDLAQMPDLDEHSPALPLVTSTRDNCLGADCPRFHDCHVYQARREALAADVLVISHHLFFADLDLRESGMARLVPGAGVVIFDEAHQLAETAAQFQGTQFGSRQLLDLAQDLHGAGLRWAPGLADWQGLRDGLRQAARTLCLLTADAGEGEGEGGLVRRSWLGPAPDGVDAPSWAEVLHVTVCALRAALTALDGLAALGPDLQQLHQRSVDLLQLLAHFAEPVEAGSVRWLEQTPTGHLRMVDSPLVVAAALRTLWPGRPVQQGAWEDDDDGNEAQVADALSWVFTSATLGDDATLGWFTQACGLEDARILRVPSPFDYARQAALYVPPQLPAPTDPDHSEQVAQWVGEAVSRLGGRTLVLTTSLRALKVIAAVLRQRFAPGSGVEVLVQGQAPRRQIMERFRQHSGAGDCAAGRVLVGSASFWEGFDVPGDALQLLVIDRLRFPSPGDPLMRARSERLALQGRSAFRELALPAAAVALKQGAGRLIRHEGDRGVLVVADTRLASRGYGKRLLRALPPMRRLLTQQEFEASLDALTRISTTDCPWT
ncbi:MAG: ATP-dependent DNA helicase [Proteobacteria bacterium]|nr:ATP-dependent DNA helicase [Pseudomonadota bacterium]